MYCVGVMDFDHKQVGRLDSSSRVCLSAPVDELVGFSRTGAAGGGQWFNENPKAWNAFWLESTFPAGDSEFRLCRYRVIESVESEDQT